MSKGLLVNVLRNTLGDSTNNGVTKFFDTFVLTGPGIPKIFDVTEDHPELRYCVEDIGCMGLVRRCARPVTSDGTVYGKDPGTDHAGPWMFGGNFVYSSDSRMPVNGLNGDHLPIPVHDRTESWKEYARNSD